MNNYKCAYAEKRKQGLTQSIWCKKTNSYCVFVRYCPTKREIELTDDSQKCVDNPYKQN